MNEMYYDKIESYLLNELSQDDKLAFEAMMESDLELKSVVEVERLGLDIGKLALEHEVRDIVNTEFAKKSETNLGKQNLIKVISFVALILLAIGVVYWAYNYFDNTSPKAQTEKYNELYASLYTEPIWPLERSEGSRLSTAMSLYLSGKTDECLKLLSSDPNNQLYKYWSIEVLVNQKRCSEALQLLNTIDSNNLNQERLKLLTNLCTQ